MVLLKIIGSINEILLVYKEFFLINPLPNIKLEHNNAFLNNYLIHQYELEVLGKSLNVNTNDKNCDLSKCLDIINELKCCLNFELKEDETILANCKYSLEEARNELLDIKSYVVSSIKEINDRKQKLEQLLYYKEIYCSFFDKNIELNKISDLNYFNYEIGTISTTNEILLKNNYESLSAVIIKIGIIKSFDEDIFIIIYPKQYKEETSKLLISLNWKALNITDSYKGIPSEMIAQIDNEIENLKTDISKISKNIMKYEENINSLFNVFSLEQKVIEVSEKAENKDNIFALNIWVHESDLNKVKESICKISDKFLVIETSAEEIGSEANTDKSNKNRFHLWNLFQSKKTYYHNKGGEQ